MNGLGWCLNSKKNLGPFKVNRSGDFHVSLQKARQLALIGPMEIGQEARYVIKHSLLPAIYVDGGQRHRDLFKNPFYSIGDRDTFPADSIHWGWAHHRLLPTHKNASDLAYALEMVPAHIQRLHLLGLWGGRMDHQLANLGEILRFLDRAQGTATAAFLGPEILVLGAGTHNLNFHGPFSVAARERTTLSLSGRLSFPLAPTSLLDDFSSFTLSNFSLGKWRVFTNRAVILIRPTIP